MYHGVCCVFVCVRAKDLRLEDDAMLAEQDGDTPLALAKERCPQDSDDTRHERRSLHLEAQRAMSRSDVSVAARSRRGKAEVVALLEGNQVTSADNHDAACFCFARCPALM